MLNNIKPRTGELCIAAVLLALALFAVWEGANMPLGSWSLPGAGYFPVALGVLLAIVAVALMFRRTQEHQDNVDLVHAKGLITLGGLALVGILFERIGAIPTFAIFLAGLFYLLGTVRWWMAILMGVGGAAFTWLLFVYILQLQLPGA